MRQKLRLGAGAQRENGGSVRQSASPQRAGLRRGCLGHENLNQGQVAMLAAPLETASSLPPSAGHAQRPCSRLSPSAYV